jgi:hypothetical protein
VAPGRGCDGLCRQVLKRLGLLTRRGFCEQRDLEATLCITDRSSFSDRSIVKELFWVSGTFHSANMS